MRKSRSFNLTLSIFLLLTALGFTGRTNEHNDGTHRHVIDVRDTPKDFKVPTILWDLIMDKPELKEKYDPLIVWLPVKVLFSAKTTAILSYNDIEFNLPRGGGSIDLSKVAAGDRGTFYLKFGLDEFNNQAAMKVYFVSNSKKRRLDSELYGSGCNVFFDITEAFKKASGEGMRFNLTDKRHLSAMAGHFVFVQQEKDKVFISQVEFTDPNSREYLCKI